MLTKDTKTFYNNWSERRNEIQGEGLDSVFNKFLTTFTIYNRLYNELPTALDAKGIQLDNKRRNLDSVKATEYPVLLLGEQGLFKLLNDGAFLKDVEGIADLIEQDIFHIHLKGGQCIKSKDTELVEHIRSSNLSLKVSAVFRLIYQVRCNLVHGSKDFLEHQRLLLEPLTLILTAINDILYLELNK